ncbi:MAG: tyrosine-type recombinase/integrase [Armatimonadota bacterium]
MEDSIFIRRLRDALAADDLADTTRARVIMDLQTYERWHHETAGQPLDPDDLAITSVDLAEFRSHLLRKWQPGTVTRCFASLRKTLRLLAPALLVSLRMPKIPQPVKPAPSGFTKKERLALLRAACQLDPRDRAIVTLAMMTGARSSSIANAKLSKLEINARSGSIEYDVTKGNRTYSVPLNAEAREALTAWLKERVPVDNDWLFVSERFPFEKLTRWSIHDIFHRRLTKFLPADLAKRIKGGHMVGRHGLARLLLEQGVPLPDVAAILNHSSVATTANIYCRPSEQDLRGHLERAVGEEPEDD